MRKDADGGSINLQLEALGGLAAGVIGTVIGYPLDLIKTRMQTRGSSENMIQLGTRIVRQEGIPALYKGMTPPLISLSILNTLNFTSYNFVRSHPIINADRGWDIRNGIAGMIGGPFGSTISTVENMLKTQMQLDNVSEKRYRNSFHCFRSLVKERGWKILYTGHVVNTVREGAFLGTYFYTYEGVRVSLGHAFQRIDSNSNGNEKPPGWTVPLAGGISGAWAWFVTFPLDCIKAGIQGQPLTKLSNSNGTIVQKLRSWDVLTNLIQTKGWKGLYAGVSPSIARAFLVSSTRFSAYEFVVWMGGDYFR